MSLRVNNFYEPSRHGNHYEGKAYLHSESTEESCESHDSIHEYREKPSMRNDKEKSQLCKKFIENGFCPYQNKCKFAHGSHELRKNKQFNSKYKTKECGVFMSTGFCLFGDRCNFIHTRVKVTLCSRVSDPQFQVIKAERRGASRLLEILGVPESQNE